MGLELLLLRRGWGPVDRVGETVQRRGHTLVQMFGAVVDTDKTLDPHDRRHLRLHFRHGVGDKRAVVDLGKFITPRRIQRPTDGEGERTARRRLGNNARGAPPVERPNPVVALDSRCSCLAVAV